MKHILGFLLLFCLFFRGLAQEGGSAGSRVLEVGDVVPVSGLPGGGLSLGDLRGKVVVIDFWATWCAPCRVLLPRLDSLQRVYGGRVQFLPVTDEPAAKVRPLLAALAKGRSWVLPWVNSDTLLGQMFPHHALPHEVWIGPSGKVLAVTEGDGVSAANLERVLAGGLPAAEEKRDVVRPYDLSRPLLVGGNGGDGASLRYHSLLTGFIPGLDGGVNISDPDSLRGQKYNARNVPFVWLCRLAFSYGRDWFPDARVAVESRDSLALNSALSGQAYERWLAAGHGYCYELQLPFALTGRAFDMMQQDLSRLFPRYAVSVEARRVRSLALVRTSAADKLKSAGGERLTEAGPFRCELRNAYLNQLMMRLSQHYLQHSKLPVVDETGYTGRVDLLLEADMSNVAELNVALARYDLRLEEREAAEKVLRIRDVPADSTN